MYAHAFSITKQDILLRFRTPIFLTYTTFFTLLSNIAHCAYFEDKWIMHSTVNINYTTVYMNVLKLGVSNQTFMPTKFLAVQKICVWTCHKQASPVMYVKTYTSVMLHMEPNIFCLGGFAKRMVCKCKKFGSRWIVFPLGKMMAGVESTMRCYGAILNLASKRYIINFVFIYSLA